MDSLKKAVYDQRNTVIIYGQLAELEDLVKAYHEKNEYSMVKCK